MTVKEDVILECTVFEGRFVVGTRQMNELKGKSTAVLQRGLHRAAWRSCSSLILL